MKRSRDRRSISKNSKGQAEMLEWFPRLLLMLVAVIVIAMLVRFFTHREVPSADIHRETYLYRIHYDGNIITYRDDVTQRVYPGVIDYMEFQKNKLDGIFDLHGKISSMLTLTGCTGEDSIYHDMDTYVQYLGYARFGTLGPGGATIQENIFPVTIWNEGETCPGTLNITIVRPNS